MSERKQAQEYAERLEWIAERTAGVDARRELRYAATFLRALADRPEQPWSVSDEMRKLAERAVEAQRNDKRTEAEIIADGVSFVMGEGFDPPVARPEPAQPPIWHRTVENDLEQEQLLRERIAAASYVDIVFDGPPSHESGRFVEVEDASGKSIKFGEWAHRPDGYWALRIAVPQEPAQPIAEVHGYGTGTVIGTLDGSDLPRGMKLYAAPPSHPAPSEAGAERHKYEPDGHEDFEDDMK